MGDDEDTAPRPGGELPKYDATAYTRWNATSFHTADEADRHVSSAGWGFIPAPQWPTPPRNWRPRTGWRPDPTWTTPTDWQWMRRTRGRRTSFIFATAGWVALLLTPAVIAISLAQPHDGHRTPYSDSVGLRIALAAAVAATVLEGALLGARRLTWAVPAAAAVGVTGLAGCYVAAFDIDQPGRPIDDNAVGAGLAIYGIPAFALLLVLLTTGFALTRAATFLRARRR